MFYRDKNLGRQISSSMFLWIPCPKNTKTRTAEEGGYRSIKYFVNYHISTYSRENIITHLVMGSEDKKLNIKKKAVFSWNTGNIRFATEENRWISHKDTTLVKNCSMEYKFINNYIYVNMPYNYPLMEQSHRYIRNRSNMNGKKNLSNQKHI